MEIFKTLNIEGFENYSISDHGKVRNNKTMRILKEADNGLGYKYVCLRNKNGTSKLFYVHRLLSLTFLCNDENKPQVHHKSGKRDENTLGNLMWVTSKENLNDVLTKQNMSLAHKGKTYKRTEEQKKNLSKAHSKKIYCVELNKVFDSILIAGTELKIQPTNISKVCKGYRKTAGGYHWEYIDTSKGF